MAVYSGATSLDAVYVGADNLAQGYYDNDNIYAGSDEVLNFPLTITIVDEVVNGTVDFFNSSLASSGTVGELVVSIISVTPDGGFTYNPNLLSASWDSDDSALRPNSAFGNNSDAYFLRVDMIQGGISGTLTISGTLPAE